MLPRPQVCYNAGGYRAANIAKLQVRQETGTATVKEDRAESEKYKPVSCSPGLKSQLLHVCVPSASSFPGFTGTGDKVKMLTGSKPDRQLQTSRFLSMKLRLPPKMPLRNGSRRQKQWCVILADFSSEKLRCACNLVLRTLLCRPMRTMMRMILHLLTLVVMRIMLHPRMLQSMVKRRIMCMTVLQGKTTSR